VPVLSVPSITDDTTARIGAQRIIAAVDARAGGDSILEVAAALASEWGVDLEAVHVVEAETRTQSLARYIGRLTSPAQNGQRSSADEMRRVGIEALSELGLTSLAEEWLKSRLAAVDGGACGRVSVRWGDPGPELVSYAQEHAALLVVGRESQRSPVVFGGNFPSGSTTRYVLWSAPCPVLVMPPIGATTTQRPRPSVMPQLQPTRLFESSYSTPVRSSSVRRFGVHAGGDGDSAA
jgi:nucleotide-binding universal stress UspA family protein